MPITNDSIQTPAATAAMPDTTQTVGAEVVAEVPAIKECAMLHHNHEADAPTSTDAATGCYVGTVDYAHGKKPDTRPDHLGMDSGVISILIVMFLIVTFTFKHFISIYRSLVQDLYVVRRRENAFDEHTASESSTIFALNIQTAICQAILLFSALNMQSPVRQGGALPLLAALTGLTIVFYYVQWAIYRTLSYAFAEPFFGSQWVRGLSATQSLMGFFLLIPALSVLFYPGSTPIMLVVAALIYVGMRIIFIIKGFRIFYENFLSLSYFILYLCALEIVPLVFLAIGAMKLSTFLQL